MKKIYIALTGLLLLSASCNIYRYEEHQSRVTQPGTAGIITSTTADLKVSETRISHTENFTHDKHENDINVNDAKEYTLSAALAKHNADVLVGPLYDITTNERNDLVSVTVTGYPATYTNFRKTTPEDSLLLSITAAMPQGSEFKSTTNTQQAWAVKRGWQNSLSATYGLFETPGLEYVGGFRFNKSLFIGFGIGANYSLGDFYGFSDYLFAPLYAQFKWYFIGNKRVNPFVGICQGIDFCTDFDGFWLGSHTRGEVGVNVRLTPKTSFFAAYSIGTTPTDWDEYPLYIGFKLGFTF